MKFSSMIRSGDCGSFSCPLRFSGEIGFGTSFLYLQRKLSASVAMLESPRSFLRKGSTLSFPSLHLSSLLILFFSWNSVELNDDITPSYQKDSFFSPPSPMKEEEFIFFFSFSVGLNSRQRVLRFPLPAGREMDSLPFPSWREILF